MNPIQFESVHFVQPRSLQHSLFVTRADGEILQLRCLCIRFQRQLIWMRLAKCLHQYFHFSGRCSFQGNVKFDFVGSAYFPREFYFLAVGLLQRNLLGAYSADRFQVQDIFASHDQRVPIFLSNLPIRLLRISNVKSRSRERFESPFSVQCRHHLPVELCIRYFARVHYEAATYRVSLRRQFHAYAAFVLYAQHKFMRDSRRKNQRRVTSLACS